MDRWASIGGFGVVAMLAAAAVAQPDDDPVTAQPEGDPAAEATEPAAPARPGASLTWTRLEGTGTCLAPEELEAAVERLTEGSTWTSPDRAGLVIDGWILRRSPPAEGFVVGVAFMTGEGEVVHRGTLRRETDDCETLDTPVIQLVTETLTRIRHRSTRSPERGRALAAPKQSTAPEFNPYRPGTSSSASEERTAQAERPLPNPYEGTPRPEAELQTFFNPYTGTDAHRTVAHNAGADRSRPGASLGFNPYIGPPPPRGAPQANPYRP